MQTSPWEYILFLSCFARVAKVNVFIQPEGKIERLFLIMLKDVRRCPNKQSRHWKKGKNDFRPFLWYARKTLFNLPLPPEITSSKSNRCHSRRVWIRGDGHGMRMRMDRAVIYKICPLIYIRPFNIGTYLFDFGVIWYFYTSKHACKHGDGANKRVAVVYDNIAWWRLKRMPTFFEFNYIKWVYFCQLFRI